MFINRLNQLYKPDRILFYTEVDEKSLADFYKGKIPECVNLYADDFSTYDYPGLFYLKGFAKPVIGIEFRSETDKSDCPKNLKSLSLKGTFFYSVEIDEDTELNLEKIQNIFKKISEDDDAHRTYTNLSISENPSIIGIFLRDKKIRILYEWQLKENRAKTIIENKLNQIDTSTLCKMAFQDSVTNHFNWNHIQAFLEVPSDAGIKDFTFVHFDIKEFKVINEVYGHKAANKVLLNIVKAMDDADFVYTSARCHNDNFAMMIKYMPLEETRRTLEDFYRKLSFFEEDPNYRICFRCGVVPMRQAMLNGNRVADAAKMAQAMGNHPGQTDIIFFTDKMHDDVSWANFIKAYLDTAIQNNEFLVYLQPKFDVSKNDLCGAEALIRWNYKGRDFLSPDRFVPFFEKDASIGKIDDIVLDCVVQTLARWKTQGKKIVPVSVNLSRSRLNDSALIDNLTSRVDKYNLPHELIDFELTESAAYDNTLHLIKILDALKSRGFKISMDDFGTGYSSLSLLTQMPLDTLKIDKSFVDKIAGGGDHKKDISVIKHIVSLAEELGFECLAEGAEDEEQVQILHKLGCNKIQGYYYGKPMPVSEFEKKFINKNMEFKSLSMQKGLELAENNPASVILDVRHTLEYKTGHIPGAEHFTMERIRAGSAARRLPDKGQMILVYCLSGHRSKLAAKKLTKLGYSNIIDLGSILNYTGKLSRT